MLNMKMFSAKPVLVWQLVSLSLLASSLLDVAHACFLNAARLCRFFPVCIN